MRRFSTVFKGIPTVFRTVSSGFQQFSKKYHSSACVLHPRPVSRALCAQASPLRMARPWARMKSAEERPGRSFLALRQGAWRLRSRHHSWETRLGCNDTVAPPRRRVRRDTAEAEQHFCEWPPYRHPMKSRCGSGACEKKGPSRKVKERGRPPAPPKLNVGAGARRASRRCEKKSHFCKEAAFAAFQH